jgi:alpha-tubulin suppressor-like RCC1 family protein
VEVFLLLHYQKVSILFRFSQSEGDVYTWGYNEHGELGLGNTTDYDTPQKIQSISNISDIYCGAFFVFGRNSKRITIGHTYIDDIETGTWYAWGYNEEGLLGLGHSNNMLSPTEAPHLKDAISISCGGAHALAIYSKKSNYCVVYYFFFYRGWFSQGLGAQW